MKLVDHSFVESLFTIEGLKVETGVSLSEISNWKVGGKVHALVQPKSLDQIIQLKKQLAENKIPNLVIGNTTNLLFTDKDIDAILLQIGSNYSSVEIEDNTIIAQPGVWVPKLARLAQQAGLMGIEHTCGIPGTLGGLVVMNGGSQRKGIGEHITYVKTVNALGELKKYSQTECVFSYRSSIFQQLDETIVEVGLHLSETVRKRAIHTEMLEILRARSKKFPRKFPNCGSVFISNPAMYEKYGPPGEVIEECGLKGISKGGAQVSPNHANFIVNNGEASSDDILYLINLIRNEVYKRTGYLMKVEAKYISNNGAIQEI